MTETRFLDSHSSKIFGRCLVRSNSQFYRPRDIIIRIGPASALSSKFLVKVENKFAMKHSPTLSFTGSICTVETARSKMNVAYQSLINAKNIVFNKLRESDFKTYPIGTADIYDKELDRIREEYYQCKFELMQFCNKPEIEKDCCTMEREFQYQYFDAKEKIVELRNLEEKQRYPSSGGPAASCSNITPSGVMTTAMNYTQTQAGPGTANMLKCESCYAATQRVSVTLRCELCKKNLGALVFN